MQAREKAFVNVCANLTRMITRMTLVPEACNLQLIVQDRSLERCLDQTFGTCPFSTGRPRETLFVECCSHQESAGAVLKRLVEQLASPRTTVWLIDFAASNVTVFRQGQDPRVVEGTFEYHGEGAFQDMRWRVSELLTSLTEEEPAGEEDGEDERCFSRTADCSDADDIPF
jgi:hypothetical protein